VTVAPTAYIGNTLLTLAGDCGSNNLYWKYSTGKNGLRVFSNTSAESEPI